MKGHTPQSATRFVKQRQSMFSFPTSPTPSLLHDAPPVSLTELKAVLRDNVGTLKHLSLVPTRTTTWKGNVIAFRIRPLLADAGQCLCIRMSESQVEDLTSAAFHDPELKITTYPTTMLLHAPVPQYHVALAPAPAGTPQTTPASCPTRARLTLYKLPTEPLEARVVLPEVDSEDEIEEVKTPHASITESAGGLGLIQGILSAPPSKDGSMVAKADGVALTHDAAAMEAGGARGNR